MSIWVKYNMGPLLEAWQHHVLRFNSHFQVNLVNRLYIFLGFPVLLTRIPEDNLWERVLCGPGASPTVSKQRRKLKALAPPRKITPCMASSFLHQSVTGSWRMAP